MNPNYAKELLKTLGFLPKENSKRIFQKKYATYWDYAVEVDFNQEKINYGELIQQDSKTTQNFAQMENWVVLECVDRLLEKGYPPQRITLEKTYPAGHKTSGRLDICVAHDNKNDENTTEYLLIECKTYGKEFDKEFARMRKDGGQLFTYFKFSNKADVIMLYSSELNGKEIVYQNEIVRIEDDYRTGDVKDFYEKWDKLTTGNGIFESWCRPYNYESRALTINDLIEIKQEDSSFIFNQFLEILRHNVVSDKPNAFNKIFTLFLCKIYDEKVNEETDNELGFQWLEGVDDHRSFQLRLTDLYKNGMYEFLEKTVTDFSETEFDHKFPFLTDQERKPILDEFYKIRLEKNNEFAIKDVYDGPSFNENAVSVKEIVQLLQKYKLRYAKKQQYLSDFFELLLTTGLKQEAGQFFTPVPVAQFIIKSLPVDKIVEEKLSKAKIDNDTLLPYVMDYAAGSGHFITEIMNEIQKLLLEKDENKYAKSVGRKIRIWKENHFSWAIDYIYGVEKDYRLVKVGKVGCYLHGDGLANVIHSDGLARFAHPDYKTKLLIKDKDFPQDNKQFDILVSNPPYSVSAFKNNARKFYGEKDFVLYSGLTDSSSEIECLFVERAKQLLKDGGIAGIILPSSILSNEGIYTKTREIILQYFEIIAIAELGSSTFMATGTNTVVLFLRRRNNYTGINLRESVKHFFVDFQDVTHNGIEKPVAEYVNHVWEGLAFDDYITLLKKEPNDAVQKHELYWEYAKAYPKQSAYYDEDTPLPLLEKMKKHYGDAVKNYWKHLFDLEEEKIYYFILAFPQQNVVVVKTGEKDAEKRFLGYEFSNRRGGEGIHPVQRGKTIEECTRLFDSVTSDNPEKASTYIYKAFTGDYEYPIHDSLKDNIFRVRLVDMLTFSRRNFEKNISTSLKKKVKIESKWKIVKLGQVATTQYGFTDKASDNGEIRYLRITDLNDDGSINLKNDKKFITPTEETKQQFLLKNNDIVVARSGSVGKSAIYKSAKYEDMIFASYLIRLQIIEDKILPDYLFNFTKTTLYWNQVEIHSIAVTQPNLNAEKIKVFQIPLPPIEIQQKIVFEIEVLEKKEAEAKRKIEGLREKIDEIIKAAFLYECKLSDVVFLEYGVALPEENRIKGDYPVVGSNGIVGWHNDFLVEAPVIVVGRKGSAGKVNWINNNCTPIDTTFFVKKKDARYSLKILYYAIKNLNLESLADGTGVPGLNRNDAYAKNINVPPLPEQQKIVAEIERIEARIAEVQIALDAVPESKKAVLKKYL